MAVFILETDNPSRRIIRLLFYVSNINTGRITTSTESASDSSSRIYTRRINSQNDEVCRKGEGTSQTQQSWRRSFLKIATLAQIAKHFSRKRKTYEDFIFFVHKLNEDVVKKRFLEELISETEAAQATALASLLSAKKERQERGCDEPSCLKFLSKTAGYM